jgi:hypothetical protein
MKDYKIWTPIKAGLNAVIAAPVGYNEREIWFCHLGENIGLEQDGKGENLFVPY